MKSQAILGFSVALFLGAIAGVIIIYLSGDAEFQTDIEKETAKTLIQLIGLILLGAFVKYQFDRYAQERTEKREKRDKARIERDILNNFRKEMLERLIANNTQLYQARLFLTAFLRPEGEFVLSEIEEQVRDIIRVMLDLSILKSQIHFARGTFKEQESIVAHISSMRDHLQDVIAVMEEIIMNPIYPQISLSNKMEML